MGQLSDWLNDIGDRIQEFFSPKKQETGSEESTSDNRLYVGNLNYSAKEEDIRNLFSKYGSLRSVHLIRDRFTRKLKGYAFVEMASEETGKALELNGAEFLGRKIIVSRAKQKSSRPRRMKSSRSPKFRRQKGMVRPFYKKEDLPPVKRLE